MKYYCLGEAVALVRTTYSNNFLKNLPYIGTPMFDKLPITQAKMREAFERSETLVLCKSMEEAKALRQAKIVIGNRGFGKQISILGCLALTV